MKRRSSSTSNVPEGKTFRRSASAIPLSTFRTSSGCKKVLGARTKSQTNLRLSQHDLNVEKAKRNSSLQKVTPLRRQNSYATPSSAGSARSSRVTASPGLKTIKTIQQLSNNPNWTAKQYQKVKEFIINSSHFDTSVVNETQIRPPTIKGFVYLVTVLFQQLYPNVVNITLQNYKEEVVMRLKELDYPGKMTVSTLKLVNTMHSWPQVMGMCGWLIDRIYLPQTATIDISSLPEEDKPRHLLPELLHHTMMKSYILFNQNAPEEALEEVEKKFVKDFKEILNTDEEKYETLKAICKREEEKKKKFEKDVETLKSLNKVLKDRHQKIVEDLQSMQESDADEEAALDVEKHHFETMKKKLIQEEIDCKAIVASMEKKIRNQPCSYKEKIELEKKIGSQKTKNSQEREKIEHAHNIKSQFDAQIEEEHKMLESEVIEWNRSVWKVCIQKPHLKKLILKEKGFHLKSFLNEIRECSEFKHEIENELKDKLSNREILESTLDIEIQGLERDLEKLESETLHLQQKSDQFSQNKDALDLKTQQIISEWDIQNAKLRAAIKDLIEDKTVEYLKKDNIALELKNEEATHALKTIQLKAITFFESLYKSVNENIKRVNDISSARQDEIEAALLNQCGDEEE